MLQFDQPACDFLPYLYCNEHCNEHSIEQCNQLVYEVLFYTEVTDPGSYKQSPPHTQIDR